MNVGNSNVAEETKGVLYIANLIRGKRVGTCFVQQHNKSRQVRRGREPNKHVLDARPLKKTAATRPLERVSCFNSMHRGVVKLTARADLYAMMTGSFTDDHIRHSTDYHRWSTVVLLMVCHPPVEYRLRSPVVRVLEVIFLQNVLPGIRRKRSPCGRCPANITKTKLSPPIDEWILIPFTKKAANAFAADSGRPSTQVRECRIT